MNTILWCIVHVYRSILPTNWSPNNLISAFPNGPGAQLPLVRGVSVELCDLRAGAAYNGLSGSWGHCIPPAATWCSTHGSVIAFGWPSSWVFCVLGLYKGRVGLTSRELHKLKWKSDLKNAAHNSGWSETQISPHLHGEYCTQLWLIDLLVYRMNHYILSHMGLKMGTPKILWHQISNFESSIWDKGISPLEISCKPCCQV